MELKQISPETTEFMACGTHYVVHRSLSVNRFIEYEKLQCHVGFGISFKALFNTIKDTYELLNKQKFADSAVKLHNAMMGIVEKAENRHPILGARY